MRMSMLRRLFCISLLTLVTSCEKIVTDEFPNQKTCEKFAGNYLMYDPELDTNYSMQVSCTYHDGNSYGDSIHFINYANRFDFGQKALNSTENLDFIYGTNIFPLADKNGNNWSFSNAGFYSGEDTTWIYGDSLVLRFEISNIAFYMDEGVPYYACDPCIHYGVKQY